MELGGLDVLMGFPRRPNILRQEIVEQQQQRRGRDEEGLV
jgi:hypothetical protein